MVRKTWSGELAPTSLIGRFLSGGISAPEFEAAYIRLWRACRDAGELSALNDRSNDALDRIFTAADAYCADPSLRAAGDLDDEQFLSEVALIAKDLGIDPMATD